mgnify:CR=1 FL=1
MKLSSRIYPKLTSKPPKRKIDQYRVSVQLSTLCMSPIEKPSSTRAITVASVAMMGGHGERTPVDDRHVRGGFHNLSLRHTRAEMIRAVFEGVAYNSRWLLRYVERFVGRRLDNIRMVGGGANSAVWCQIHADVLDRTIRQVQDPVQANVRGIALLAGVACGNITVEQIGDVAIANTYHPNPANRAIYDELFAAYEAIYKKNNGIYRRLNGCLLYTSDAADE